MLDNILPFKTFYAHHACFKNQGKLTITIRTGKIWGNLKTSKTSKMSWWTDATLPWHNGFIGSQLKLEFV